LRSRRFAFGEGAGPRMSSLSSFANAVPEARSGGGKKTAVLVNIQVLRAAAAFLVIFVHIAPLAARAGASPHAFEFGNSGVDLFFVISGLIMVFTTRRRETTAANFMAHRIARIVPFYWFMTFTVFAIALAAPALLQSTRADFGDLARSLAFVPYRKANGFVQPVVFVGWTLNYEMAFYVLFAAGLLTGRRVLGALLTLAALGAAAVAGYALRPAGLYGAFYTAPIVLEFGLGMLLGLALPHLPRSRTAARLAAPAGAFCMALLIVTPSIWPDADRFFLFGLPAAGAVFSALVLERAGAVVRVPLLTRLGDASYATYLTHFFVTQVAVKAAAVFGLADAGAAIALGAVTFAAAGAVGLAVHYGIEKPLSAAARRVLLPPKPKPIAETIAPALSDA